MASLDAYEQGRLAGRPPHLLLVPIERRDDLPTGLPPMTIVGVDGPADHAWLPGVLRLIVRVSSILQTADDVSAEVLNALTVILGHLPDAAPASLDDQALKTLQAQCQRVVSSVRSLRLLHV